MFFHNGLLVIADSYECESETTFKCLSSNTFTEMDIVQLLTTGIPPDLCAYVCIKFISLTKWDLPTTDKKDPNKKNYFLCFRNIEFRGQYCLASATAPTAGASFPVQCKSILRLLKELTQDFVDNTPCNTEPLILIPIQEKSKSTRPPRKSAKFNVLGRHFLVNLMMHSNS